MPALCFAWGLLFAAQDTGQVFFRGVDGGQMKLLCQMMELDECLVRRSFVTLDEDGNILTAQGPLSFFLDKIVRKRIRKRIVTVEVELLGEKRRIELGIRLPEDK